MSKVSVQNGRGAIHGNALCWAARIISLLPGTGATAYVSVTTAIWAAQYGNVGHIFQNATMFFAILVLPGLIAWRWHLVGGIIMLLESTYNILMIASSIANHDPYAYFELDPSYVLRAILPMWMTILVGALLHLIAWGRER